MLLLLVQEVGLNCELQRYLEGFDWQTELLSDCALLAAQPVAAAAAGSFASLPLLQAAINRPRGLACAAGFPNGLAHVTRHIFLHLKKIMQHLVQALLLAVVCCTCHAFQPVLLPQVSSRCANTAAKHIRKTETELAAYKRGDIRMPSSEPQVQQRQCAAHEP
jgi:hypothetical protein